ncbi:MAG: hypothetical protein D6731_02775 [Planctomycetota bacterium]|nr:MAG: hypothetical protein D6731_02775 [Planctomycetota bacterium]
MRARIRSTSPSASTRPRCMRTMVCVMLSTSWRTWLERTMCLPAAPSATMSSRNSRRTIGSVPVSGSSRNKTSGSWTRAWASLTRWRMPRE